MTYRKESDQLLLDYCALKKAYTELQSKVQLDGAIDGNGRVRRCLCVIFTISCIISRVVVESSVSP